jgi:hypothetical protein
MPQKNVNFYRRGVPNDAVNFGRLVQPNYGISNWALGQNVTINAYVNSNSTTNGMKIMPMKISR